MLVRPVGRPTEFVQNLVRSPRRNEVNRFATVLRGEFVLVQRRSYAQCVWRSHVTEHIPVHQFVFTTTLRFAFAEQEMALPSEHAAFRFQVTHR